MMEYHMKRKQFHMTAEDERVLKELAQNKGISEAEIVRDSLRAYAAQNLKKKNPLLEMAKKAEQNECDSPGDLSTNHDHYLWEMHQNEKQ